LYRGKVVTAGDIDISQCTVEVKDPALTLVRLDLNDDTLPRPCSSFDVVISIEGIEQLQNQ
jgi:hypothetical protein